MPARQRERHRHLHHVHQWFHTSSRSRKRNRHLQRHLGESMASLSTHSGSRWDCGCGRGHHPADHLSLPALAEQNCHQEGPLLRSSARQAAELRQEGVGSPLLLLALLGMALQRPSGSWDHVVLQLLPLCRRLGSGLWFLSPTAALEQPSAGASHRERAQQQRALTLRPSRGSSALAGRAGYLQGNVHRTASQLLDKSLVCGSHLELCLCHLHGHGTQDVQECPCQSGNIHVVDRKPPACGDECRGHRKVDRGCPRRSRTEPK
mmetsp:Transcript_24085/g.53354  ORF Transcript_24085/g.53354 Transcript_24085/m.53354 type:complete len:263 (-) Transcript_24085:2117-2905(-)